MMSVPELQVPRRRWRTMASIGAAAVGPAIVLVALAAALVPRSEETATRRAAVASSDPPAKVAVPQSPAKVAVPQSPAPRGLKVDYVIDLNTRATTALPKAIIRSAAELGQYAASPDGSRLAYVGDDDDGTPQIFVAGIDGGGIRQVTHDPMRAASPAWSPDGTKIAYGGFGSLFVLDVATGESTAIGDAGGPWAQPQFTPDGSSVLYTDTISPSFAVLRTVPIGGGTNKVLIGPEQGMGYAGNGSLSPDGLLVTMMGHEINGPGAARFVSNVDGTERRHIPEGGSNPAGAWSPDGGRIVCSDYRGKNILVVDIETGVASRVAKGRAAIWLDGHTLLVEVS